MMGHCKNYACVGNEWVIVVQTLVADSYSPATHAADVEAAEARLTAVKSTVGAEMDVALGRALEGRVEVGQLHTAGELVRGWGRGRWRRQGRGQA